MNKMNFSAAMVAAAALSLAQAPTLRFVATINDPLRPATDPPVAFLSGQGINAVAVDGTTLYYGGFNSGAGSTLGVMKVENWNRATRTFSEIATRTGMAPNRPTQLNVANGLIYWASSLGSGPPATQIWRLNPDGSFATSLSGPFVDGIMDMAAGEFGSWSPGNSTQDMAIDPGFGGTPRLAMTIFGSRVLKRFDLATGAEVASIAPNSASAAFNVNMRGITFDGNSNVILRSNNDVWRAERTLENGTSNSGLSDGTIVSNLTDSSSAFQRVLWVPGGATWSPFLVVNDRAAQPWMKFMDPTTGNMTGFPSFGNPPYTNNVMDFATANVNGTQYLFLAGFKGGTQGIDVFQMSEDGNVAGSITLSDTNPSGNRDYTVTIALRDPLLPLTDPAGLLDSRTFVFPRTSASLNYTFFTAVRGDVVVTATSDGFTRKSVAGVAPGATPITANFALANGNANNDGEVGPADFSAILAAFGIEFDPLNLANGYSDSLDLDNNDEIGPGDFLIVLSNFGAEGDF